MASNLKEHLNDGHGWHKIKQIRKLHLKKMQNKRERERASKKVKAYFFHHSRRPLFNYDYVFAFINKLLDLP